MFALQHQVTPFLWHDKQAGDGVRVVRKARTTMTMSWFEIAALHRAYDGG